MARHLSCAPRAKVVPASVGTPSKSGEGDVADNLGGPDVGEGLEEDEARDFST
jgi:hypothetical protein